MLCCIFPKRHYEKYILVEDIISGKMKDIIFKAGDIVYVIEQNPNNNWCSVKHLRTGKTGDIPKNFIALMDGEIENHPAFINISSAEAILKLMTPNTKCGTFLIRPSNSNSNAFVLCVKYESEPEQFNVSQYKIYCNEGYYIYPNKIFKTFAGLLQYYTENDGLVVKLRPAYSSTRYMPPLDSMEIPRSEIKLLNCIQKGLFGDVYKATWCEKMIVSVKIFSDDSISLGDIQREITIMHKLQHPYIMQILGVCSTERPIYLVSEFMCHGNLKNFFRENESKSRTEEHLVENIYQIAQGMKYLISNNYIHRDLRAENILVGRDLTVKISDFGLARMTTEDVYRVRHKTLLFPMRWAAPEIIIRGNIFSEKTDVWSFGILCYEIMSRGKEPYENETLDVVMENVRNGKILEFPSSFICNDYVKELMKSCWKFIDDERPTFSNIVDKTRQQYFSV